MINSDSGSIINSDGGLGIHCVELCVFVYVHGSSDNGLKKVPSASYKVVGVRRYSWL